MNTPQNTRPHSWIRIILVQGMRLAALLIVVLGLGFVAFAYSVISLPTPSFRVQADAIVALTGGEERIAEAVKLLAEGNAKRLLISGVYPTTTKPELMVFNGLRQGDAYLFRCCVDLDKHSNNTENNAVETTAWARRQGFRSLIVVTSSYHMPRSLIELRQAMPDVDLIPFPVRTRSLDVGGLGKKQCLRFLAKEYVKFLTAAVRYAAKSLKDGLEPGSNAPRVVSARAT